jgi:phage gpG-like protein
VAEAVTSYSVDNDRKFRDALKRAQDAVGDLRVPFGLILADFYRSEQAIFKLQSAGQYPDFKNGGPESRYAKLKEKTVGFKYPLLFRSGKLAASLLSKDATGSVAIVGQASLIIGTTIAYGIYHQSDAARKKIPQRKFLFIGPEASKFATSDQQGRPARWMNILNDYVLKQSKSSGAFSNG